MSAVSFILVFIFIAIGVVNKSKKDVNSAGGIKRIPRESGVAKQMHGPTQGSANIREKKTSISQISRAMENRSDDWLARQLADERQAKKRMSDMFQLREEHARHCASDSIREEHTRACQAEGVDNGLS